MARWQGITDLKDLARAMRHLRRNDGAALGSLLRQRLPSRECRRAGASVLADEAIAFEFSGGGFDWAVPAGDLITVGLLADGDWLAAMATGTSDWLRARAPRSGAVLEVGAHVGTTTLVLAREGWQVIAVEPVPLTRPFLERNLDRNGLSSSVTVVPSAIAEVSGPVQLSVPRAHGGSRITTAAGDIEVMGETLAEIADRHGEIAFVWGAADGGELLTIRSGTRLWAQGVPLYLKVVPQYDSVIADETVRHFSHFVGVDDIVGDPDGAPTQPIAVLARYLASEPRYADVLLLP